MYGGIALVSSVLTDMAQDFEAIRYSVFWRIVMILEVALVYSGTMILIRRSITARKSDESHASVEP